MGAKGIVEGIDTVELEAREYRQSTQLVECGGGGGEGPSRQEPPRCQQGQWSAAAAGKDFAGGNHHSVGEGRLQCSAAEVGRPRRQEPPRRQRRLKKSAPARVAVGFGGGRRWGRRRLRRG
nr:hypothetical protein [Oryza sativa Japonica Group]